MKDIFDNTFRLNPLYTFILFEDLSEDQKTRFRAKNFYGFFHAPREAKLTVKGVNRSLADFLNALREPKRLSDLFLKANREIKGDQHHFIIQLVLDGMLEVRLDDRFCSGVEAVNRLLLPAAVPTGFDDDRQKKNHIQALSDRALYFAYSSIVREPLNMSFFLYNFNRLPLNRRWRSLIPDERALCEYLDLSDEGAWPGMPDGVAPQEIRKDSEGNPNIFDLYWRSWNLKEIKPSKDVPSYKVYFSPLLQDLPDVFRIVRDAACRSEAYFMKVGRSLTGILRADKLMVYFPEYRRARDFADKMSASLFSFRYHGTPFTFQVNPASPLVSMGVDPPPRYGEKYSWRLYVTHKLSLAIQAALRAGARDPKSYLHSYMRILGVDSISWCPIRDDWSMEFQIEVQER